MTVKVSEEASLINKAEILTRVSMRPIQRTFPVIPLVRVLLLGDDAMPVPVVRWAADDWLGNFEPLLECRIISVKVKGTSHIRMWKHQRGLSCSWIHGNNPASSKKKYFP